MRIFRKIMIAIICAGFVFAAGYGIASDPNYESMIVKTKEPIPAPEYDRLLRATKSLYMKQISAFREDLKSSPFYKISHPFKGRWLNIIPIRTEPWQLFHDPIFVGELRNVSDIDFRWPRFFGAEEPMAFRTQLDDFRACAKVS